MLRLEHSHADEIIAHARENTPNECCGIIAGRDGHAADLYRAVNVEGCSCHYKIGDEELVGIYYDILSNGWDVLVIYHSHTHTEAYPSPTDVRLAAWPEAYYVIVSLADESNPVLRAFRIQDGEVVEVELEVV